MAVAPRGAHIPFVTTLAERRPATGRSMLPREHGAYGQLVFPLLVALSSAPPTAASLAFAAATTSLFFAHEPLVVLLGHRGARARREEETRARRLAGWLVAFALGSGLVGFALAPNAARVATTLPLGLGAGLAWLVAHDREKTTPGELLAAATFASAALPVALAGGLPPELALGSCVAWTVGLGSGVLAVRAVVGAMRKQPRDATVARLAIPAALASCFLLPISPWALGAIAALAVPAWTVAMVLPHPRSLRRVGWALVAASVVAASTLVAAAHVRPEGPADVVTRS